METNLANAYDVLSVSQTASNAEITKSFAIAMKHRKYSPDAIAKARKSLMNPEERIVADYLRPVLPTINQFKCQDFIALDEPVPTIDWLSEFDRLEESIADADEVSEIDRQLGSALF
ncbi:hypothetical protein [Chamaesiphon minutus]|uniref:Uncharacterized protein n=1 Tax=Chamaesiphon minutus (strain ATCC 27169 / PCC 6605) TaxID=1173020 RepID=K9UK31_CHAP6|nr:hypothetical protein [Chamaesiphon minutus]AFY95180.1 hypothetical protein Cha6605_4238 [Chamaesiphon minutus PCC 6605]